jgi:hypothetical protein
VVSGGGLVGALFQHSFALVVVLWICVIHFSLVEAFLVVMTLFKLVKLDIWLGESQCEWLKLLLNTK